MWLDLTHLEVDGRLTPAPILVTLGSPDDSSSGGGGGGGAL